MFKLLDMQGMILLLETEPHIYMSLHKMQIFWEWTRGGTAIGWSTRMLGRIGYAFWQFMCQKGYGFVPVRVRVSRCRPCRGIHFLGEHPPRGEWNNSYVRHVQVPMMSAELE